MNKLYTYPRTIVCAAVKDVNGDIHLGVRHANCSTAFNEKSVQGFIDNKNQFLTREEAYEVACASGQVKYYSSNLLHELMKEGRKPQLFSENLY